jgi:hypothetical protein
MDEWLFFGLLHNLTVKSSIGNNYISVAPLTDPRVDSLRKRSPAFCKFVESFTDQFERQRHPSLLLLRKRKNVPPRPEGVLDFRNALAISSITQAWERYLGWGSQFDHLRFSNYFDFYPYTLTQDEAYLRTHTASLLGADTADRFHGQCSPSLGRSALNNEPFFDAVLFAALLDKWVEYHVKKKRGWSTRALFRSLGMAYRASALPPLDLYDLGTNLALWVSAFEILVHPGKGAIGYKEVLDLLGNGIFLYNPKLEYRSYTILEGKKKQPRKVTLAQKTYYEIYQTRNAFLHGNPVHDSNLFPGRKLKHTMLTMGVVLIYKCALMAFLKMFERHRDISVDEPVTPDSAKIIDKIFWQRDLEIALKKLRQPK